MSREVLISFATEEQAKVFYNWFEIFGYHELISSDLVNDDLPYEEFYNNPKYTEPKSTKGYYQIKIEKNENY